jgi:predicted RNase H-like HicB family nuclease
MFCEYIQATISKAVYEVIDDEEPYYGEVPELKGVWATGKTPEECRENLQMAIEDWIAFSLQSSLPIPTIEGLRKKLQWNRSRSKITERALGLKILSRRS